MSKGKVERLLTKETTKKLEANVFIKSEDNIVTVSTQILPPPLTNTIETELLSIEELFNTNYAPTSFLQPAYSAPLPQYVMHDYPFSFPIPNSTTNYYQPPPFQTPTYTLPLTLPTVHIKEEKQQIESPVKKAKKKKSVSKTKQPKIDKLPPASTSYNGSSNANSCENCNYIYCIM